MGCGGSSPASAATPLTSPPQQDSPGNREKDTAREENKEYQQKLRFLCQVQLFKRLPKDQHPQLAAACSSAVFHRGQVVIKQGDEGKEFFIIRSGQASVFTGKGPQQNRVATLKAGDYFGEQALLRDDPRTATITAESELTTFKITRASFQELGLHQKLHFANRKAVGGGGARTIETKPPSPKTDEEKELIAQGLRNNENLQTMVKLDEQRIQQIISVAWKEVVPAGTAIITEGDLIADYFYIVQEGSFQVLVTETDEEPPPGAVLVNTAGGTAKSVSTVGVKGSFGELALLYLVPRAATVKAREDSVVWVIDRAKFKSILMKVSDKKIDHFVQCLNGVEILAPLVAEEKRAIARALVEMHFAKDEVILQQGEQGHTFYILYDGEVSVIKDGKLQTTLSASMPAAIFFGERALLNNEPRAATVVVTSSTAKALALDRDSFNLLLGPLEDIIKRSQDWGKKRSSRVHNFNVKTLRGPDEREKTRDHIKKKDLARVGLLGCGGFGVVELFSHKTTGETFAVKSLSKGYIVKTGMQESVINEKFILLMTNSPFIIKLYDTFNGTDMLYFVLEAALGGELYATYNRRSFYGSERHARYYSAGVIFAFEHLHERRIIYRDLKPENLLLTSKGHIKITDMGLAKFVIGKSFTTCGTPDYFAPELIACTGHTNAVDWWTLGILIFELMSGHPPFESKYPMQTYSKVLDGIGKVNFPLQCQGPVGDGIKDLLKKDPSERLPMRPGGVKNLKEHKWYQSIDWQAMQLQTFAPPYLPTVKNPTDVTNFSASLDDMPKVLPYEDDGSGWDKDFATG